MKTKITILIVGLILISGAFAGPLKSGAQGVRPELFINWRADSYAPPTFQGKVLPASDSRITIGVDMFESGKPVNLALYKVFWYIDEKFYQGATGLTRININAPHFIGENSITVRVSITNYGNEPGKTIGIPVAVPEAVIQSSAPDVSPASAPFNLQAYPYFFNVKDPSELGFDWSLNGTRVSTKNPFLVTREMADRGTSRVELSVNNPKNPIERITENLTILR